MICQQIQCRSCANQVIDTLLEKKRDVDHLQVLLIALTAQSFNVVCMNDK